MSRLLVLGLVLIATPVAARDVHLSRLSIGDCAADGVPSLQADQAAFGSLVAQLSEAGAPTQISPVTTSGPAGFDVSLETTYSTLDRQNEALQRGFGSATCNAAGSAPGQLFGNRVRFTKGLPLGLSLGAQAGLIHDSALYVVGVDAQLALLEEVWKLPDLAVRAAISRLVGASELGLYAMSFDALLSHRFVLFQRMELSPFAGVGARWTRASARADLTPNIDAVDCAAGADAVCNASVGASRDDFANDVHFARVSQLRYRAFAGVRLRVSHFALAGAVGFDPVEPELDSEKLPRQWTLSVAPSVTF